MVCAKTRAKEKSLDDVISKMQRMLRSGNHQEILSITEPRTMLAEIEALIQRACTTRGDERGSLRTVAAKPANPGTEEDCVE